MNKHSPRIALVHALRESVEPIRLAFATHWPEAEIFNVLDDSLSAAAEVSGGLTEPIVDRFLELARYAVKRGPGGRDVDGMLVTSTAFMEAIERVKAELHIPVMGPYEAAFQVAIEQARQVGLLTTFKPSQSVLEAELHRFARAKGVELVVRPLYVSGALEALQAGDVAGHNVRIAAAAEQLRDSELIIFGQFSMAKALHIMPPDLAARVLTTPVCAVTEMRKALGS